MSVTGTMNYASGDLSICMTLTKPNRGKEIELVKLKFKDTIDIEVDLVENDIATIDSRVTLVGAINNSLTVAGIDAREIPDLKKELDRLYCSFAGAQSELIVGRIKGYRRAANYVYGNNKNFILEGNSVKTILHKTFNTNDKVTLAFEVLTPGNYVTTFSMLLNSTGRPITFSSERKSPFDKEEYLMSQVKEWLEEAKEKPFGKDSRLEHLSRSTLGQYNNLRHMLGLLLYRLNNGYNL